MIVGFVAMVLMTVVPCRAGWSYLGSEVSSGLTQDDDSDAYSGWEYSITNISTSADSSGASASADCEASCWAEVTGGSMSRSPYASCSSWSLSRYAWFGPPPSDDLSISWSVDGSGTVEVAGWINSVYFVTGDSGSSSASASGSISSYEYGSAGASGSVSDGSNGSASVDVGGDAEEDSSDIDDGYFEYYYATLSYSVDVDDSDTLVDRMQFTAETQIGASASCSASVSATYFGNVFASSDAEAGGSASVSVSW